MCIINSIVCSGGFIAGVIMALYLIMYNVHTCSLHNYAVVEVVPHLNAVLSRMVIQLGAIKHENMQWVFSYG